MTLTPVRRMMFLSHLCASFCRRNRVGLFFSNSSSSQQNFFRRQAAFFFRNNFKFCCRDEGSKVTGVKKPLTTTTSFFFTRNLKKERKKNPCQKIQKSSQLFSQGTKFTFRTLVFLVPRLFIERHLTD